ncbi:MAG: lactate utilization protein [Proteobacteria bacterium]|nr:lactate utilization protein [Pseudomonadota bacterium]MBU1584919.1 lactate utilization protein [Pseudomonadota bacterium]MBU2456268.1 lactate utilization protein [Pseudomonadota bacterium]MBU2630459.1 lactate utilization protein [Pseudomonadota bacterium]
MENTNQNEFILNIKAALRKSPAMDSAGSTKIFTRNDKDKDAQNILVTPNPIKDRKTLLELLVYQANLLNINIFPKATTRMAAKAIKKLIQQKSPEWGEKKSIIKWKHPLIDALKLEEQFENDDVTLYTTESECIPSDNDREIHRANLIESYVGITSADFCVAESATLILRTRPNQPRAVSLVPSIHIAVINVEQILENLKELYFRLIHDPKEKQLGLTNCMTFISGPSKTGDIELVMVHGAHGPRELILYVITG